MKMRAIVGLLLCTLLVTGCSGNDSSEAYNRMVDSEREVLKIYEEDSEASLEDDLRTLNDVMSTKYILDELAVLPVEKPAGMAFLDNSIVISDEKNDCIVQCALDGNEISRIGETGSAPSEFLSPAVINVYDNRIFILDKGNNRIQILDREMNYIDSIDLESDDSKYDPQSLAVNKDAVYVGGISLTDSVVHKYNTDGSHEKIGANFIGSVSNKNEKIYAINSMSLFYDKKNDSIGAITTGPAFLFEINNDSTDVVAELPKGFNITSFEVNNEDIVAISASGSAVFRLGMDGRYKETLAYIDGLDKEENPTIDMDSEGNYYVCMPSAGKVFRLTEK